MNAPTPEEREQLAAKYGEALRILTSGPFTLAIRKPGKIEYMRFKTEAADERKRVIATENLLRSVLVWPTREVLDRWLDEAPALPDDVSEPMLELVGITGKAALEKP